MKAVIQRVQSAQVLVDGRLTGKIGKGLLVFVGVGKGDGEGDISYMVSKIPDLRIFEDASGKFNLSLKEMNGEMLIVSQFTLYGDCRKGRRPSYSDAAPPARAEGMFEQFLEIVRRRVPGAQSGRFQAMMQVSLVNSGPVTLMLDSRKAF